MAVNVNFGTTTKDIRWLDKAPTWAITNLACDIYDPVDRLNPVLVIDNNANFDISSCNYMEIPDFGRFYWITSVDGSAGHRLTVSGHVDVLMSYKDEIRACPCIAERSTSDYNFYLQDGRRLFNSYVYNDYHTIGIDIGAPDTVVLITVG